MSSLWVFRNWSISAHLSYLRVQSCPRFLALPLGADNLLSTHTFGTCKVFVSHLALSWDLVLGHSLCSEAMALLGFWWDALGVYQSLYFAGIQTLTLVLLWWASSESSELFQAPAVVLSQAPGFPPAHAWFRGQEPRIWSKLMQIVPSLWPFPTWDFLPHPKLCPLTLEPTKMEPAARTEAALLPGLETLRITAPRVCPYIESHQASACL